MKPLIYLWGDSIGHGVIFDPERKRYRLTPNRCTRVLEAHGLTIEDHARMGATVMDGYEDFCATETQPGAVAVLEYGGNDCDLDWNGVCAHPEVFHDGKIPLAEFGALLDAFIARTRERDIRPMLVTPPPLVSGRFLRWISRGRDEATIRRYLGDDEHIYRWQERYAQEVRDAGRRAGCEVLDLRKVFLNALNFPDLMCEDGMHPNEAGQQLMARAILTAYPG